MGQVKPVFKCASAYKKNFKNSNCLLLISVGQDAHENEKFEQTIKLIGTSFKACIISLYDSLQRFTMSLNNRYCPEFFHEISVKEGDLWLDRNEKFYSKLTIPYKITRWDSWLKHPDFILQKEKLLNLMNIDPNFKIAFDETVGNYISKYSRRLGSHEGYNEERARKLCFEYVLEECTVLCLWPELQCQYEIYPSRHNSAMEETRKRFIRPYYSELLQIISLGFRNAKQAKPQNFLLLKDKLKTMALEI